MIKPVSVAALPVAENFVIQKNRIENNAGPGTASKRVCVVTGTHGDELEGQYVCARLAKILSDGKHKLSGIVDIYPAVNPLGIDSVTRGFPMFDLDMNRIFPGSSSGSLAEVAAHDVIRDIDGADMCIDIHSSNIFLREVPQVRVSEQNESFLLQYAMMLNVDLVWIHASATVLEATLAHTLNMRGVKTLVVEMGVGMRITESYCSQLLDGILNLLRELGMWSGAGGQTRAPLVSKDHNVGFLNSDAGGIFIPRAVHGSHVNTGDSVGIVLDPLTGAIVEETLAPCSGLLFTLREYPVVFGGSLLARIMEDVKNG
ncbi:MAG: succinylglutamate desuccinylase/aspartoacylase family protein [Chitinispirillales bacterium]|jgi:predicted deacylase|nr:succinylglutamate desuccinylase/aspartoacylase family protein [Chitinispirillales bacterium]